MDEVINYIDIIAASAVFRAAFFYFNETGWITTVTVLLIGVGIFAINLVYINIIIAITFLLDILLIISNIFGSFS